MVRICLYVYVRVARPMIVGARLMAVMLWQLHEYYITKVDYTLIPPSLLTVCVDAKKLKEFEKQRTKHQVLYP